VKQQYAAEEQKYFSPSSRARHQQPTQLQEQAAVDVAVVWHKWNDLRLQDHEPAYHAHEKGPVAGAKRYFDHVLHVHLIEARLLQGGSRVGKLPRCAPLRARFWLQSVLDLERTLAASSQRLVVRVIEEDVVEEFFRPLALEGSCAAGSASGRSSGDGEDVGRVVDVRWHVCAHEEFCWEEQETERRVAEFASTQGSRCSFRRFWGSQTVHHKDDLPFPQGAFPENKGDYNRAAKKCPVREPLVLGRLRSFPQFLAGYLEKTSLDVKSFFHDVLLSEAGLATWWAKAFPGLEGAAAPTEIMTRMKIKNTPADENAAEVARHPHEPPAYALENGFEHVWRGGETAAAEYLKQFFASPEKLWNYRGATESFASGAAANPVLSGTRFSPWLAFGNVTARQILHHARRCETNHGKKSSGKGLGKIGSTGQRLHTELNFRDFLRFSAYFSWGKKLFLRGGPFSLKGGDVPWATPSDFRDDKGAAVRQSFRRWQLGQTGFPFVDAGMRELLQTGYLSHLHRQCCASFLVRDLDIDWRWGAEWFEATLIDYTPDANWGNWAYRILPRPCLIPNRNKFVAAVGRGTAETKKTNTSRHLSTLECVAWPLVHDPQFTHTLHWVPELRKVQRKYGPNVAREPWMRRRAANVSDLRACFAEPYLFEKAIGGCGRKIDIRPFKDSPLWFCAANRTNWDYEYWWLPRKAWVVEKLDVERESQASRPGGKIEKGKPSSLEDADIEIGLGGLDFEEEDHYPLHPLVDPVSMGAVTTISLPVNEADHVWF